MKMWNDIGVRVELMSSELKAHYDKLVARDFSVAYAAFGAINTPGSFLFRFYDDDPNNNLAGYFSEEFRQVYRAARSEVDEVERAKLYRRSEDILLRDHVVIPLYTPTQRRLVSPQLEGWVDNTRDAHPARFLRWKK